MTKCRGPQAVDFSAFADKCVLRDYHRSAFFHVSPGSLGASWMEAPRSEVNRKGRVWFAFACFLSIKAEIWAVENVPQVNNQLWTSIGLENEGESS